MYMIAQEVYERYFVATVGKFYQQEEKERLLALFAAARGIDRDNPRYMELVEVVKEVELLGIDNAIECNNYLLMCDDTQSRSEICLAVGALKNVLLNPERRETVKYSNIIEWRLKVYSALDKNRDRRLEAGLIEYAAGNTEIAITHLSCLVGEGNIYALEYLAVIHSYDTKDSLKALIYNLILGKVFTKLLHIDIPEWVEERITKAKKKLNDEKVNDTEQCGYDQYIKLFSSEKRIIGFAASNN